MKRLTPMVVALAVMLLVPVVAGAGGPSTDGVSGPGATVDTGSAIVLLNGEPLATYEKTRPPKGKKVDFSGKAVKSYRAHLSALRNEFRQWLRANAPKAKVNGEFDVALNAVSVELNGERLEAIKAAPMVRAAEYQALYRPLGHDDPDLALVHAFEAWTSGGGTSTAMGAGVKVAIVDSGIDVSHPCFADGNSANDGAYTNDKVIHAAVYYMKNRRDKLSPADENGHGTHVAGTVACNLHTPASLDGVAVPYAPSGVAPAATLGNFNVFPGSVGSARSEDIVDALEDAYELGFDVANMSLGGGSSGFNDLLAHATDNLDLANMVVAVAAGNSGPGFSTIESPGKAARALTAGGITVGHFVAALVDTPAADGPYAAASGDFETVESDLTAPLGVVTGPDTSSVTGLAQACVALPAGSLAGEIALISRGTCTFSQKIRNAQDAGAVAALVVNNVGGDPTAMGLGGIANEPTIPAYMVSMADGAALKPQDGAATTIPAAMSYYRSGNDNFQYGSSSWGPTDVDFRIKPDVVAPAVNVLSSQPAWACEAAPCWAFFQGTSMATPHLAGAAAVVLAQRPGLSAAEVRSAIVNTADQGVVLNTTGTALQTSVNVIGAGRANVLSALGARVALDPVSVSFGATPSGSGKAATRTVSLTTLSGSGPYTATITDQTCDGLFSASVSGETVVVGMAPPKFAGAAQCQATLRVHAGGAEVAHAAVYALLT